MAIASAASTHSPASKHSPPSKHNSPGKPSNASKTDRAGAETRRAELGRFLKASRSRVSPDEVGLPPGPRRRTPGLRREEVALLAGVGITWYTWLEQGQPINASTQVLDAVARTLRLDPPGRWHLYRLAEATPVRSWTVSDVVPEAVLEVLQSLGSAPAMLINSRYDVIESNPASQDFFWDWHSLPCVHRNTLWCCVTEAQARSQFVNCERRGPVHGRADARGLRRARGQAGSGRRTSPPEEPEPGVRRPVGPPWVAGPGPRGSGSSSSGRRDFMSFTTTEFDLPTCPEVRMVVYTPADEQTRGPAGGDPQAPAGLTRSAAGLAVAWLATPAVKKRPRPRSGEARVRGPGWATRPLGSSQSSWRPSAVRSSRAAGTCCPPLRCPCRRRPCRCGTPLRRRCRQRRCRQRRYRQRRCPHRRGRHRRPAGSN